MKIRQMISNPFDSSFEKLLESFLILAEQDPQLAKESTGFEFECGAHNVSVFPIGDSQLVVEVDVTTLQPVEAASAPLLMILHRLNEAARSEHRWMATIDEEDRILISKSLLIAETDAVALQVAVSAAIDHAETLAALVARIGNEPLDESSDIPQEDTPHPLQLA